MLSAFPTEIALVLLLLGLAAIAWRFKADRQHLSELKSSASRAFRDLDVQSQDERYQFNGSSATIERREETGGGRGLFSSTADLSITIYARNPHGERFLFRWHSKSAHAPSVKHLPHSVAGAP